MIYKIYRANGVEIDKTVSSLKAKQLKALYSMALGESIQIRSEKCNLKLTRK